MGVVEDKIKDLKDREQQILKMGGDKAVAKQKEKGKLTARERLNLLFDPGTFREIDMFVEHRCVNFGMENVDIPSDGVITGHGQVEGRPVFAALPGTSPTDRVKHLRRALPPMTFHPLQSARR